MQRQYLQVGDVVEHWFKGKGQEFPYTDELNLAGDQKILDRLYIFCSRFSKELGIDHEKIERVLWEACNEVMKSRMEPLSIRQFERGGKKDITVCITYFMRFQDLHNLVKSIPPKYGILIQDTGGNVSWARNMLIHRCATKYLFLMEEDME